MKSTTRLQTVDKNDPDHEKKQGKKVMTSVTIRKASGSGFVVNHGFKSESLTGYYPDDDTFAFDDEESMRAHVKKALAALVE